MRIFANVLTTFREKTNHTSLLGGDQQTGRSTEGHWNSFLQGSSLRGSSDALVSDGGCKHDTAPRALHTRKPFTRVWLRAQHALFFGSPKKVIFIRTGHVPRAVIVA